MGPIIPHKKAPPQLIAVARLLNPLPCSREMTNREQLEKLNAEIVAARERYTRTSEEINKLLFSGKDIAAKHAERTRAFDNYNRLVDQQLSLVERITLEKLRLDEEFRPKSPTS